MGVYLAYNANNGLPFVPAYKLNADVPSAAGLIRGNDVRIGGARVGIVSAIEPHVYRNGAVGARIVLKLDKQIADLPADTTLRIRPRSPLGLKYVELTRGSSSHTLADGATLVSQTSTPVELDDFFNIFNRPTREGARTSLDEFGTGVAGRGPGLNAALARLDSLARHLRPVASNLMDRRSRFGSLFPAMARAAREVAPVAREQGALFVALDQTFTGWASVTGPLRDSIAQGPPSLDTATRELPAQARFVNASAALFRGLRPAFASLSDASTELAPAIRSGLRALPRTPALNRRLNHTLDAVQGFADDPRTDPGLARLAETANLLRSLIAFATPGQTVCNYYALFFRNLESALSESDVVGSFLRVAVMALPQLPDSEAGPAAAPANGPDKVDFARIGDSYLHSNPYPNTAAPGQVRECEAANESGSSGYLPNRQVIGNVPGSQGTYSEATK